MGLAEDHGNRVLDWPGRLALEDLMSDPTILLDAAGRRRLPATLPGFLAGRAPHDKGMEYPPDPPRPEEIVRVMRQAGQDRYGLRVRALIAVLWRAGLRISEALALAETDIDPTRGSVLVRHGKGDKRREAGMDPFGFAQLAVASPPRAAAARTAVLRHRRANPRQTGTPTSGRPTDLQGIDPIEIIDTVRTRRPPTFPMTAGLNL